MVDPDWMMQAMMGDKLILRLHLTPSNNPKVEIRAYTYWAEEGIYNGSVLVYRHWEGEHRSEIEFQWFNNDREAWKSDFMVESEFWPTPWHQSLNTVCTIGTTASNTRQISAGHPQALVHIAGMQAAAQLADFSSVGGFPFVSLGIYRERLGGIVTSALKSWRTLIDQK